jgi:hypothetical protein
MSDNIEAILKNILQELKTVRIQNTEMVQFMREAEKEIPEFMRRFMNYYHDAHDVRFMYENLGHPVPPHVNREIERCDDRYRQLLEALHTGGGAFEKVRQEMAKDPMNRWDHTRFLEKPKERPNG